MGGLTPIQRYRHASATFEISGISRVCSHQLVRHRLASYSQESQRHVSAPLTSCVIPPTVQESEAAMYVWGVALDAITHALTELHALGVPLEDTRYIAPQATPTRIVVTRRFEGWSDFLNKRLGKAAQWEIRQLAEQISDYLRAADPEVFV